MRILVLVFIFVFSCQSEEEKRSPGIDNQSQDGLAEKKTDDDGEAEPAVQKSSKGKPGYKVRLGDRFMSETRTKAWSTDQSEPNYEPAAQSISQVDAVYVDTLNCKYRHKIEAAGSVSFQDVGCRTQSELSCGDSPEAQAECSENALESRTIGEFVNASGKESVCITKTSVDNVNTITKTITEEWKHHRAFADDLVFKRVTQTCSLTVSEEQLNENVDPCTPDSAQIASVTRSEWEIKEQIRGPGGVKHTAVEASALELDTENLAAAQNASVNCTVAGGKLNVTLAKASCKEDTLRGMQWSLSELPIDEVKNSPLIESQVSFNYGAALVAATPHSCNISISKDNFNQMIEGTLSCGNKYTLEGANIDLKSASFKCFAPEGYSSFDIDESKPFAGKLAPAIEDPNTGAITPADETDGSGNSGNDSSSDNSNNSSDANSNSNSGSNGGNQGGDSNNASNNSGSSNTGNNNSGNSNNNSSLNIPANAQVVFVSSFTSQGDLSWGGKSGRAGADARCTKAAQDSSLGLQGTFRALLSNQASNLRDHANIKGPVYNTNGEMVAANIDEFIGGLRTSMSFNENGQAMGAVHVHTGSKSNGEHRNARSCYHWTRVNTIVTRTRWGIADRLDGKRFDNDDSGCDKTAHVYCMQQK